MKARQPFIMRMLGLFLLVLIQHTSAAEQTSLQLWPIPKEPEIPNHSYIRPWLCVDRSDNAWLLVTGKLFRLTKDTWTEVATKDLKGKSVLLHRSRNGDVYLTASISAKGPTQVFRLHNGTLEPVTPPPIDSYKLGVTDHGHLYFTSNDMLGVFRDGQWVATETSLTHFWFVHTFPKRTIFYDGRDLFSLDATGIIRPHPRPATNLALTQLEGTAWGNENFIRFAPNNEGIEAFNIHSGEIVPLPDALKTYPNIVSTVSLRNGDVLFSTDTATARLTTTGELLPLPYFPLGGQSVETPDGSVLAPYNRNQLHIFRNGSLETWGWKSGINDLVNHLQVDSKGYVWFLCGKTIGKLKLGKGRPADVPDTKVWEETPATGLSQIKPGVLAMKRTEPSGYSRELSIWDGHSWKHLSFNTNSYDLYAAYNDQGQSFLFSGDQTFEFKDNVLKALAPPAQVLVEQATLGVRRIFGAPFLNAWMGEKNTIWFSCHPNLFRLGGVSHYDGKTWHLLGTDQFYAAPSARHGAVFGNGEYGWRHWTEHGTAEFTEPGWGKIPDKPSAPVQLMVNEFGVQPYEREMIRPLCLPVLRKGSPGRHDTEFADSLFFDESQLPENGIKLPGEAAFLQPAASGGFWLYLNKPNANRNLPYARVFPPVVLPIAFEGTPLENREIGSVFEDAGGNLWFGEQRWNHAAWKYRLSDLRMKCSKPPGQCSRSLEIRPSVSPKVSDVHLLSRIQPTGEWTLQSGNSVVLRFPESGEYDCTIIGEKLGGRLRDEIKFRVKATVSLPDTVRSSPDTAGIILKDWEWVPQVIAKPTNNKSKPEIWWRVKNKPWEKLGAFIDLTEIPPGEFNFEFRAQEDGYWCDPSPLNITATLAPNYSEVIEQLINELHTGNAATKDAAKIRLNRLPPQVHAILLDKINQLRVIQKQAQEIRDTILQLRSEQPH